MRPTLWQFAQIECVYQRLAPLTPYGRAAVALRQLVCDENELTRRYDRIESMAAFLRAPVEKVDALRHRLKGIAKLPAAVESPADLFLVKKFLINAKAAFDCIDTAARQQFGFVWSSEALLKSLDTDGNGDESFYIGDRCDPALAGVRQEIRRLNESLDSLRNAVIESLRRRHGLDLSRREFLVIESHRATAIGAGQVFVEPFDSRHVIVRPVLPAQHVDLLARRQGLLERESQLEAEIVARLAAAVDEERNALDDYARAIEALDIAFASAELARELNLTRPRLLAAEAPMRIVAARLVPLEEECRRQQLEYRPLTLHADRPHVLLHGSNMTGKSVVLKTVAAMQILAQLGQFVPAERFDTVVFDRMRFVGASAADDARGLSSFGLEMVDLRDALDDRGSASLFIVDEFARTTNSTEAAALIAGLLNLLNQATGMHSFLATHYEGLPGFDRVLACRMRGIDWAKLRACRDVNDPAERVRAINRCVPYQVVADSTGAAPHDAIDLAAMLGLDGSIVAFARRQIGAASR